MSVTAVEMLKAGKEIISDPSKWIQGAGSDTGDLKTATCFCTFTAFIRARDTIEEKHGMLYDASVDADSALDAAATQLYGNPITSVAYNDLPTTRHSDIMRLYDLAIEKASVI
ncbi:hypothetical protein EVB91_166 [Rhizobium phage RHph_I1_18]|nr:hypothetical protein EVB91_166 [Rhizobium phage RHph_I1_18]